jgi:peptidoglycan L-alanyl-D-glutamate endopeptidase CwlK
MLEAIMTSMVDFTFVEGHRPPERQFELYKKGREKIEGKWQVADPTKVVTNVDGFIKKSNHNYDPSMAGDIRAYVKGNPKLAYDPFHLAYLGGHITNTAQNLLAEGRITHRLRWGANWDEDGELIYDQGLDDSPHFELVAIKH